MSPLSGVLGEAWALYRRHAAHFMLISFSIYLVIAVINALLSWGLGTVGAYLGLIFTMFGIFLLQSALVLAVQDVRDGRVDLDLGATISAALPFLGSVAVASILASIGIGIGFIVLIVPGLILLTFWSLIIPEIVIGRAGAMDSFSRSWRTVRGYAWNVFGVYVLVFLILIAIDIVLGAILYSLPYGWRSFISSLVSGGLVAPFVALVVTLVYYRLTAAHGQQAEPGGPGPGYGATPGGWPGTDQGPAGPGS
jgi:MFS family permease